MYGFRYHLVTVIAVFMALGTGILLGGSIGQDLFPKEQLALLDSLEEKYKASQMENSKWSRKVSELTRQLGQTDQAVRQIADLHVKERLAGRKIVLVQLEKGDAAKVAAWLQNAGAQVRATVRIKDPEALPDTSALPALAEELGTPRETNGTALLARIAQVLANSVAGEASAEWPAFLQGKGWLETQGRLGERPDAVLVLAGTGKNGKTRMQMFDLPFLKELRKHNIRVVGAERSDAESSIVPGYRGLGIPTVDNVEQASGLVSLVELIDGTDGNFGVKPTADALIPRLGGGSTERRMEVRQP